MTHQHPALIFSLYQIGAIQFGDFTLKSGQQSPIYINLRKIISHPLLLRTIAKALWEKARICRFDLICGVPYTALPIATCIALEHNLPMVMRRKEKKEHGTKQLIEGDFKPGQRCLIIEDVMTTGGSLIETAEDLKNAELAVQDFVALIDRGQRENDKLSDYQVHTVISLSDILNTLLSSTLISPRERRVIKEYSETIS